MRNIYASMVTYKYITLTADGSNRATLGHFAAIKAPTNSRDLSTKFGSIEAESGTSPRSQYF